MTTRSDLKRIKSRALRTKLWFKVLSNIERSIINLTIRCVENVRSETLSKAISKIAQKIAMSQEEDFVAKAEKIGSVIAEKLSIVANQWGNKTSSDWKFDTGFIRFLGVNAIFA